MKLFPFFHALTRTCSGGFICYLMTLSLRPGDTGWQSRLSAGTWSLSPDLAQETHLLLGSPSRSHQTYIMCALWEPGSQSVLPTTRYSNPTRTGDLQKMANPLPGCDQYMVMGMVKRLSLSKTWCCQPRAETPIAMPCPETPQGLHPWPWPSPRPRPVHKLSLGAEWSLSWDREASQCLRCQEEGGVSSIWVKLERVGQAWPVESQDLIIPGRQVDGERWGCRWAEARNLAHAPLSQGPKYKFKH